MLEENLSCKAYALPHAKCGQHFFSLYLNQRNFAFKLPGGGEGKSPKCFSFPKSPSSSRNLRTLGILFRKKEDFASRCWHILPIEKE